jgi:hypothetical protein
MSRRALVSALAAFTLPSPTIIQSSAVAQTGCDPFTTTHYLHQAPTSTQVLGFALGSQEVDVGQSNQYLDAVADASARVIDGTAATSVQGRPVRYAVVGRADRMTAAALATIRANATALRDPTISASQAATLEAATPRSCGSRRTSTATRRAARTRRSRPSTSSLTVTIAS